MFNCYRLHDFIIRNDPNQMLILLNGAREYYKILRTAFNQNSFSTMFDDRYRPNYWGTYIHSIDENTRNSAICLLELFKKAVFIQDGLDQTFALDYHKQPGGDRTEIGSIVYQAKPYKRPYSQSNKQNAVVLAKHFANFISQHPSYLTADFIISVPTLADKKFDVPDILRVELCNKLNIKSGQNHVHKIKKTVSMKDIDAIDAKSENIRGAFQVDASHPFKNKTVIVIDDLYDSGATLHELANTLQSVGAKVFGLVATKTSMGLR